VKTRLWLRVYASSKYDFWRILTKFSKIKCEKDFVIKKIRETGSRDQRHETGRLKHAHTEDNVTTPTLNETVALLNHRDQ